MWYYCSLQIFRTLLLPKIGTGIASSNSDRFIFFNAIFFVLLSLNSCINKTWDLYTNQFVLQRFYPFRGVSPSVSIMAVRRATDRLEAAQLVVCRPIQSDDHHVDVAPQRIYVYIIVLDWLRQYVLRGPDHRPNVDSCPHRNFQLYTTRALFLRSLPTNASFVCARSTSPPSLSSHYWPCVCDMFVWEEPVFFWQVYAERYEGSIVYRARSKCIRCVLHTYLVMTAWVHWNPLKMETYRFMKLTQYMPTWVRHAYLSTYFNSKNIF